MIFWIINKPANSNLETIRNSSNQFVLPATKSITLRKVQGHLKFQTTATNCTLSILNFIIVGRWKYPLQYCRWSMSCKHNQPIGASGKGMCHKNHSHTNKMKTKITSSQIIIYTCNTFTIQKTHPYTLHRSSHQASAYLFYLHTYIYILYICIQRKQFTVENRLIYLNKFDIIDWSGGFYLYKHTFHMFKTRHSTYQHCMEPISHSRWIDFSLLSVFLSCFAVSTLVCI